jgi:hypothetical protein
MTGRFIGIRWWLGAAFAVVAAVSTSIVVAQFSSRSQNALRAHAAEQAARSAALAAKGPSIVREARLQDLELRLYNPAGKLIGSGSPVQGSVREGARARAEQAALRRPALRGHARRPRVRVRLPVKRGALCSE